MKHILLKAALVIGLPVSALSQKVPYKNLVLEGGGVRGFAYAGAFEVLDSMGILQGIERVGGTSAGAIQAALLGVGYTPREIVALTGNIKPQDFNDGAWFVGTGMRRIKKQFGYYKGDKIADWIEGLIAAKTGNGNITFAELHQQRAEKGYKDIYITGTDLTYQCLRVFSYEQYPDMQLRDAVRISLSIPVYYKAVFMDDQGKIYDKPTSAKGLHVMVDGGALSNYPVSLFDSSRYAGQEGANMYMENPATLGLMMEIPEQIEFNKVQAGKYPLAINNMKDYIKAVYITLIDKASPEAEGKTQYHRTITISTLGQSGRVRKLPAKVIQDWLDSGREGARQFFLRM